MKKSFLLSLLFSCLLLLLLVLISSCAKQQQVTASKVNQPIKATIGGGEPSGSWYMLLNGVTECINKSYPGSTVTAIPGNALSNVTRINSKQVDLGLCHNIVAADAIEGNEPFEEKLSNVALVASFYPTYYQLVVDKKLGVTSLDEVITRKMKIRLSADQVGSIAELSFKRLLNEYGVTYDDIKKWGGDIVFRNKTDSSNMLADGYIDGYSTVALFPATHIQEASLSKDLVFLSINQSAIDSLSQKYGYSKGVIPANAYKFNDQDFNTFKALNVLIVSKDAPDDIAYKVARSIHQNIDYLKSVHSTVKEMKPEDLAQNSGIPLHKGAEKYYREAGIIK